jgi:hypothetical protein
MASMAYFRSLYLFMHKQHVQNARDLLRKSQLQEEEHIIVLTVRNGGIKYVELGCHRIRKNCPEIL